MLGAGMMVVTDELQRPASDAAAAGQFDITIAGRTISLRHKPTGHVYEYLWFRSTPHLRCGVVRDKPAAEIPARRLRAQARDAAIVKLQQAGLLEPSTSSVSGRDSGPR